MKISNCQLMEIVIQIYAKQGFFRAYAFFFIYYQFKFIFNFFTLSEVNPLELIREASM